jgi:hypothetical protein
MIGPEALPVVRKPGADVLVLGGREDDIAVSIISAI